jgi:hypothetical protein
VLLLVCDFYRLELNKLAAAIGLSKIVNAATCGVHTSGMCFSSRPDLFKCSVVAVSVVSDHRALVICGINDALIF